MNLRHTLNRHKNLMESFISLSIINAVNMFLPFISLPYMLRIIGPANYGIYSYVFTLIQYLILITSYGFMFSATKQVSQNRDDNISLNNIFTSVFFSRCILLIGSLIVFAILAPLLLDTPEKLKMFWWGTGMVIGEILMPTYLYQGLEKMRFLAIVNIIPKVIFTILIFIVIKQPQDYQYIIILNSLGYIIAGICSMSIAYHQFGVKISRPCIEHIKFQLKEGFSIFASTMGMNLYRNSNILILGLLCNDSVVGIYAAAEKIIKALQSVTLPLIQSLFPHMSLQLKDKPLKEAATTILKISAKMFYILILFSAIAYLLSPLMSDIILGKDFQAAIPLIRIMTLVVLLGGINYTLGIIGLINLNKGKQFFHYVVISGVTSILVLLIFANRYTYYAAAWAMVIAELISCILCYTTLKKQKSMS
ncbi:hypothetical protein E4T81_10665 [Barnesiella sp. WM24]|nr:hypothetical protein E4T81_10665 [Barnesiella sp. WM24]